MGVVMVICPSTGRAFSTGIESDTRTFPSLPDVLSARNVPTAGPSISGGHARLGLRQMAAMMLGP